MYTEGQKVIYSRALGGASSGKPSPREDIVVKFLRAGKESRSEVEFLEPHWRAGERTWVRTGLLRAIPEDDRSFAKHADTHVLVTLASDGVVWAYADKLGVRVTIVDYDLDRTDLYDERWRRTLVTTEDDPTARREAFAFTQPALAAPHKLAFVEDARPPYIEYPAGG